MKWIAEIKVALNGKLERGLAEYVSAYQAMRMAGAYSQKAKVQNVKDYANLCNYIVAQNLHTMEDMETCSERIDNAMDEYKQTMNACTARRKELMELLNLADSFKQNAPIIDKLNTIHFKGVREKYMKEHETEIRLYRMTKRKLSACCDIEQPLPLTEWQREISMLLSKSEKASEAFKQLREETYTLWQIKRQIEYVLDAEKKEETQEHPREHHEASRLYW